MRFAKLRKRSSAFPAAARTGAIAVVCFSRSHLAPRLRSVFPGMYAESGARSYLLVCVFQTACDLSSSVRGYSIDWKIATWGLLRSRAGELSWHRQVGWTPAPGIRKGCHYILDGLERHMWWACRHSRRGRRSAGLPGRGFVRPPHAV